MRVQWNAVILARVELSDRSAEPASLAGNTGGDELERDMNTTLVVTTAAAIALACFDLRPAAAAPATGPAIAKQNVADEFSGARKRRRGGNAFPIAAFGAIVGTIASIAAAERRREYYAAAPYYGGPVEGAYAAPYGYEPDVYQEQVYPGEVYPAPGAAYAPRAYYGGRGYAPRVHQGRAFAPNVQHNVARQAFRPQGAAPRVGGGPPRAGAQAAHQHRKH
jgi:hypothetical protein